MGWIERYGRESTERYLQIYYLNLYSSENWLWGLGLGAYAIEYIRSSTHWVYEMQMHAFMMQMGMLGFILIVLNYIVFIWRIILFDINYKYLYVTIICFLFWILDSAF